MREDLEYRFKARDLIPGYGLMSNVSRYLNDGTIDDTLKMGLSVAALLFYNAAFFTLLPSTLERILTKF